MLKYDIQNHFWQFTKNSSEKFNYQWNKAYTDFVI